MLHKTLPSFMRHTLVVYDSSNVLMPLDISTRLAMSYVLCQQNHFAKLLSNSAENRTIRSLKSILRSCFSDRNIMSSISGGKIDDILNVVFQSIHLQRVKALNCDVFPCNAAAFIPGKEQTESEVGLCADVYFTP
jgi:hypothetical protein